MKSRKFFTLLALMVGFMTLVSCKGQAKNNETASSETTGKETAAPVHINKADFLKKVYNFEVVRMNGNILAISRLSSTFMPIGVAHAK